MLIDGVLNSSWKPIPDECDNVEKVFYEILYNILYNKEPVILEKPQ